MKLGAAILTKKLKRGSSRVGELKLMDELSELPLEDKKYGPGDLRKYREWAAMLMTQDARLAAYRKSKR